MHLCLCPICTHHIVLYEHEECIIATRIIAMLCFGSAPQEFTNSVQQPLETISFEQFMGLALNSLEESAARRLKCLGSEHIVHFVSWRLTCYCEKWWTVRNNQHLNIKAKETITANS